MLTTCVLKPPEPFYSPMKRLLFLFIAFMTVVMPSDAAPDSAARVEGTLDKMRVLSKESKWNELIAQFKGEDLASWGNLPDKVSEAASLRGKAYVILKDGANAAKDLKLAAERSPKSGERWHELGDLYGGLLGDDEQALGAYNKAFQCTGKSMGWLSISIVANIPGLICPCLLGSSILTTTVRVCGLTIESTCATVPSIS